MDITDVEALLRHCIKERRAEGVAVRNGLMTLRFDRPVEDALYWNPKYPDRTLCLIGATKSESRQEAAIFLGISMEDARDLEHGFERWTLTGANQNSPFYKLGSQLAMELETEELTAQGATSGS